MEVWPHGKDSLKTIIKLGHSHATEFNFMHLAIGIILFSITHILK